MSAGYIYILKNPSIQGHLKIGMTTRSPEDRARELSQSSGVPAPFDVTWFEEVVDCEVAEGMIHSRLAKFRVTNRREFFYLPVRDAIRELTRIADEVGRPVPNSTPPVCESLKEDAAIAAEVGSIEIETQPNSRIPLTGTPSECAVSKRTMEDGTMGIQSQIPADDLRSFGKRLVEDELIKNNFKVASVDNKGVDFAAERDGEHFAVYVGTRHFRENSIESKEQVVFDKVLNRLCEAASKLGKLPMIAYVVCVSSEKKIHFFFTSAAHIRAKFKKVKHGYNLYLSEAKIRQYIDDPKIVYACWPDENLERFARRTNKAPSVIR